MSRDALLIELHHLSSDLQTRPAGIPHPQEARLHLVLALTVPHKYAIKLLRGLRVVPCHGPAKIVGFE
jgi:hypothetical protein